VVLRLFPEQRFTPEQIERLADHITGFSLAAITAASGQAATRSQSLRASAPPFPSPQHRPT
jgi:hypothetical protein